MSREHFQIWAQEWLPSPDPISQSCSFRLTNYATVGTAVDGVVLHSRGQQAPLRNGSIIGVLGLVFNEREEKRTPFLEFRFSLEGSILAEADLWESALQRTRSPETSPPASVVSLPSESGGVRVRGGVSFVGDDVEPVFVLEVRGTAVLAGGSSNDYHIVHGPKASACAAAPGCDAPCPPLVLGSQQAGREHFETA